MRAALLALLLVASTHAWAGTVSITDSTMSAIGCKSFPSEPQQYAPGTTVSLQVHDATRLQALGLKVSKGDATTAIIIDTTHFKVTNTKGVTVHLVLDAEGNVAVDPNG